MDEITAEYAAAELAPVAKLELRHALSIGCKTDLGRVRENNEDKFEFFIPSDDSKLAARGSVFLVCDGMGGHAAGQIASELACKTFIDNYYRFPGTDAEQAARSAVVAADRFVSEVGRAVPSRRGMGTTLTSVILIQNRCLVAHVGDSRAYRWREGRLDALTTDHTWIETMVASEAMTREEAERHEYRHVLMRAIGGEDQTLADTAWHDLMPGDTFLLCSDGLTNHVDDAEIQRTLGELHPAEACWRLVTSALADGGSDNCTALVARVDRFEPVTPTG